MTWSAKYVAFDVHPPTTVTSVRDEGGPVLVRSAPETHGRAIRARRITAAHAPPLPTPSPRHPLSPSRQVQDTPHVDAPGLRALCRCA